MVHWNPPPHSEGISRCLPWPLWHIRSMCNTYRIKPKRGAEGLARRVGEAAALVSDLVRKSDKAPAVRADGRVELMRWGFHRDFNPSINNARSDKLEGGMWRDAFDERRCVIPMSLFYEWGPLRTGFGGKKQAHEIRDPDGDYLWAAGIWEAHPDYGPCCSMITTGASPLMAPVHDRMPALLRPAEMQEWLAGSGKWEFQPFAGRLVLTPCASPLAKPSGGGMFQQGDLF